MPERIRHKPINIKQKSWKAQEISMNVGGCIRVTEEAPTITIGDNITITS